MYHRRCRGSFDSLPLSGLTSDFWDKFLGAAVRHRRYCAARLPIRFLGRLVVRRRAAIAVRERLRTKQQTLPEGRKVPFRPRIYAGRSHQALAQSRMSPFAGARYSFRAIFGPSLIASPAPARPLLSSFLRVRPRAHCAMAHSGTSPIAPSSAMTRPAPTTARSSSTMARS